MLHLKLLNYLYKLKTNVFFMRTLHMLNDQHVFCMFMYLHDQDQEVLSEKEELLNSQQNKDKPALFVTKLQPLVVKMQLTAAIKKQHVSISHNNKYTVHKSDKLILLLKSYCLENGK